jgi:hypothetical protein
MLLKPTGVMRKTANLFSEQSQTQTPCQTASQSVMQTVGEIDCGDRTDLQFGEMQDGWKGRKRDEATTNDHKRRCCTGLDVVKGGSEL